MPDSTQDRARVRVPPPLVFLVAIGLGVGFEKLSGGPELSLGSSLLKPLAVLASVAGVGLIAWAIVLFLRQGQDPAPWTSTPGVILRGPYRFTRNPMYTGMALVQVGIGIGTRNLWTLALVPLAMAIVYFTAIRHEEVYLETKFGESYREYRDAVRRWL